MKALVPMTSLSIVGVIMVCVLYYLRTRGNAIPPAPPPRGRALPLPNGGKNAAPWYVSWSNFSNAAFDKTAMTVTYKAGKIGGSSGAQFKANPFKTFPRDSAAMGCAIFVPSNFDFTKGGKLGPGLCIGISPDQCATGGNWARDSGSARVSFTDDGRATAYIYYPTQVDSQPRSYHAEKSGATGDHLFVNAATTLRRGAWNQVGIGVTLGSPKSVGRLDFWVNGASFSSPVAWRTQDTVHISGVLFATFFGGSNTSWAPDTDQTLRFANFWVA